MVKVCHMTSAHSAEDERIFFKEAISCAGAGYETYLVARGESYDKNGVHIVGVGEPSGGRFFRMTGFAKTIYETALSLNADIYHFHDAELLPYGLKLKKWGKTVIFDSHENTVEQIREKTWIPTFVRKPLYYAFDAYQRRICSQMDAVISVTPHICNYFRQVNPRTRMITNYPALRPLAKCAQAYPNSICFAGGIDCQWSHETVLRAMEQVNGCTYVLCGRGSVDYLQTLRALPAWKQVAFLGTLPHEEIHVLLGGCTVGLSILQYSHNSGGKTGTMGNTKIFEEMMAGLPIICTEFELWKEFVDRYHCGICVDPGDVDEIATAIQYLLDHPEQARRMGENGRRAVEAEFNWGKEEEKLLALYQEVLAHE